MSKIPFCLMLALPAFLLLLRFCLGKRLPWLAIFALQILGGWGVMKFAMWIFAQEMWWQIKPWDDSMAFYLGWGWSFILFLLALPIYWVLCFTVSRVKRIRKPQFG